MKYLYNICGKISLVSYIFSLYQLWHLCQYGGVRSHVLALVLGVIVCVGTFVLWMILRRRFQRENTTSFRKKKIFYIEMTVFIMVTLFWGGRIIYSGIKYNGALSWKIDEWLHQREIKLEHTNIFQTGVEGILTDLDEALDLPKELYICEKMQLTFDKNGTIQSIYTFLYGKDEKGKERTYLVDYHANKSNKIKVRLDGNANGTYDEDMRLSPMIKILKSAKWENQVKVWTKRFDNQSIYEIVYFGRRDFEVKSGLRYVSGDVDGDGKDMGENHIVKLNGGGKIVGFEVSLHIQEQENVEPVRYIMEPMYISQEELSEENTKQQIQEAKDAEKWMVDRNTGTMYFFLNRKNGWCFVVKDAAVGSRFYRMEKTTDGGKTWKAINENPFGTQTGVVEGLVFFNENFGVAGLTGASQSASALYITQDGGISFKEIILPLYTVTELPQSAKDYGFTIEDYDYMHMPEENNSVLTINVTTEGAEAEGIVFQSVDKGVTWKYKGVK